MDDGRVRRSLVTGALVWLPIRMTLYYIGSAILLFAVIPWAIRLLDAHLPTWEPGGPVRTIGFGVFIIGFVIYTACAAWLMAHGQGPYIEFDPPKRFVGSGPYRWCRNPVAAAVLVTILGLAVHFASPALMGFFVFGIGLAHAQVVLLEEPLLRTRFGDEYEAYCRTVPRWFPRIPKKALT